MQNFKQNCYYGNYYRPSLPEFCAENKLEIKKMIEKGCDPYEIAMNRAIKHFMVGDSIDFETLESCTHHWCPEAKQTAIEGLVSKGFLIKCDAQEIASILDNGFSYTKDTKTNSDDPNLSNLIDYMDQFTFGVYFICLCFEKEGFFEPKGFWGWNSIWDNQTRQLGYKMLESYGYLRPAYQYKFSFGYETNKYKYYLFRKSIFQDFPEALEEYIC